MKGSGVALAVVSSLAVLLAGCATTPLSGTYTSVTPFAEYAAGHQTVALLPFDVLALAKEDNGEDVEGEDAAANVGEGAEVFVEADAEAQAKAGERARELRRWLHDELRKDAEKGRLAIAFQDLDETDAKLARHTGGGSPAEIAETLGVDAVLVTRMTFTKLGSLLASAVTQGITEALTGGILSSGSRTGSVGIRRHTDAVAMDTALYDGSSGDELWVLGDEVSDAALARVLAKGLVSELERSFPYRER